MDHRLSRFRKWNRLGDVVGTKQFSKVAVLTRFISPTEYVFERHSDGRIKTFGSYQAAFDKVTDHENQFVMEIYLSPDRVEEFKRKA